MNPIPTKAMEPKNRTTAINKVRNLCNRVANDHFRIPDTQCVNLLNPLSKPNIIRPKKEEELMCSNFPKREYNQGTTVKETNNESKVDMMTVTQNCARILATKPVDIAMGKNTTTITNVIALTVKPISFAPSNAARTLFFPISIWRWIFSITTMASSTRIPTTRDNPNKDIRFKVYPMKRNPINVAINDKGIATIVIAALRRLCKKNNMIKPTSTIANIKSFITWLAALKVYSLESLATNICIPSFS